MISQLTISQAEVKELRSGCQIKTTYALSFIDRLRGLLFRRSLCVDECLAISPCRSIHTFGMRYALDVVFVDCFGCVTDVFLDIVPWRVVRSTSRLSVSAIEFKAGTLTSKDFTIGVPLFIPLTIEHSSNVREY